jgi:hypothetical protein
MTAVDATATLRSELRSVLRSAGVDVDDSFEDSRSLIQAGLLDSVALFELVLWMEAKIGHAVDPQSTDIAHEWDSIAHILRYVERANARMRPVIPVAPRRDAALREAKAPDGDAVSIARYDRRTHKRSVARFLTGLWSPDAERNLRYLEWKYESNPFAGEPRIYLAYIGGEIVATRGFYASRWELGSPARQHTVLVADDSLVDERLRNQSVMRRIMHTALEDLRRDGEDFVFNLAGGPVTVLTSLAMGWVSAGRFGPLRRMSRTGALRARWRAALSSTPVLWRYAGRALASIPGGPPFARFDRLPPRLEAVDSVPLSASREPRVAEMAELVARIGHDGRLRHVRDARWLEWRFRNPLVDYRYVYAGRERLDGYVVLGSRAHRPVSQDPVHIADLEAVDARTRAALLQAVTRPGLFEELRAWSATLPPGEVDTLTGAGFRPFTRTAARLSEPCVLVRSTAPQRPREQWLLDGKPLLQPQSWDLRMLYTMAS